ncbi:MAG: hypothetical protein AAGF12_41500 [Myxococcota bacterium]
MRRQAAVNRRISSRRSGVRLGFERSAPRRAGLALGVAVACGLLAAPALAQTADNDEAARLFRAGRAAFEAGDFEAAARAFEAADELVPSGAALYNAGRAWREVGQDARALDAFQRALTDSLPARELRVAEEAVAALRGSAGMVHVRGEGELSVDYVRQRTLPARAWLPPGEHELRIERPVGEPFIETIRVDAGGDSIIHVPAAEPEVIDDRDSDEIIAAPPPATPLGFRPIFGWTLLGVGAAAGIVGAVTGVLALVRRDEFLDSKRLDQEARDGASTLRLVTNILWIGGGTALAAGLLLLLWPSGDEAPVSYDAQTMTLRF